MAQSNISAEHIYSTYFLAVVCLGTCQGLSGAWLSEWSQGVIAREPTRRRRSQGNLEGKIWSLVVQSRVESEARLISPTDGLPLWNYTGVGANDSAMDENGPGTLNATNVEQYVSDLFEVQPD